MTKDMNTGRLLYIICLLTISVVGGNLKAQTIVKHQIGFDIRPVRIPTNIISSVVTVLSAFWKEIMHGRRPLTSHFPYI